MSNLTSNRFVQRAKELGEVYGAISFVVLQVSGVAAALGFAGEAETEEFRFAALVMLFLGFIDVMVLAVFFLPVMRTVRRHSWKAGLALIVITLGLGAGAYRSTYEARAVDQLVLGEKPTLQHIAFDADGTLMAAEFNYGLRVRALASKQEWQLDDWTGVSNDRLMLRSNPPQLIVTRLTEGDYRQATIWTWPLGGTQVKQEYQLGPSSNKDKDLDCVPQDWAPLEQAGLLAIAYACSTVVVPQQAGGFVEIVQLVNNGPPPSPRRMPPPGVDQPDVPGGTSCMPRRVDFHERNGFVIGVYDCISDKKRTYHVKRWTYENGEYASWSPLLDKTEKWTLLGLQQGPGGVPRIAAARGSRVELWLPDDTQSELLSWLKYDSVYAFAPQNVALSPDGKWAADMEVSRAQTGPSRSIAIQQFGVWFAGQIRTAPFDPLWQKLLKTKESPAASPA